MLYSVILFVFFAASLAADAGEFIRGFFSCDPQTDENFKMIKAVGGNYVHSYSGRPDTEEGFRNAQKILDMAAKHGLKVMLNFKTVKLKKHKDYLDLYRKYVRHYKDHPALGAWFIYDEPKAGDYELVKALYNTVKQEDSKHPVMLVTNWIEGWHRFADCTDLHMVDHYPVHSEPFPEAPLDNYSTFLHAAGKLRNAKPLVAVPQIMCWRNYSNQAHLKEYDKSKLRYPNKIELRYFCFSAIAQGVRGLFFYSFYDIVVRDRNKKRFCNEIGSIVKEVEAFNKLTEGAVIKDVSTNTVTGFPPCFITSFKNSDGLYVVLTNNSKKTLVDFQTGIGIKGDAYRLIPWGNSAASQVGLKNSVLRVKKIDPWETLIWQLKKEDEK